MQDLEHVSKLHFEALYSYYWVIFPGQTFLTEYGNLYLDQEDSLRLFFLAFEDYHKSAILKLVKVNLISIKVHSHIFCNILMV